MKTISIDELKEYSEIESKFEECNEPIYIEKNGQKKFVLMDIALYEKMINDAYEVQTILKGFEDIDNNKLYDGPSSLENIRNKYGFNKI